jgi:hypothetical protein
MSMSASLGSFAPAPRPAERLDHPFDDPFVPRTSTGVEPADVARRGDGGPVPGGYEGPRNTLQRRHIVALASAVAVLLVLSVFARALSEASLVTERAAALRAENAILQERLAAGRREVDLVKGDAFARLQARAYGFGITGERVFALASDAPPPPAITPLGAPPPGARARTPVDDWLELLFGA